MRHKLQQVGWRRRRRRRRRRVVTAKGHSVNKTELQYILCGFRLVRFRGLTKMRQLDIFTGRL